MSLAVIFSLSVIAFAQINSTYNEYVDVLAEEYPDYNDALSHTGIRLDFGDQVPTMVPYVSDIEIDPAYIQDGWGVSNAPELRIPGIRRYSPDTDIKITEADLEIIFEFAYQVISEHRPLAYDGDFIDALREADLYDMFFSTIDVMILNQLTEYEKAYLQEQRELRNQRIQMQPEQYNEK